MISMIVIVVVCAILAIAMIVDAVTGNGPGMSEREYRRMKAPPRLDRW